MGKIKEQPRYNVISMRISDEEKEALEQVRRMTRKSVSDIMREAMWLLQGKIDNCGKMAR
jgi:predicted DNA-binding protein